MGVFLGLAAAYFFGVFMEYLQDEGVALGAIAHALVFVLSVLTILLLASKSLLHG